MDSLTPPEIISILSDTLVAITAILGFFGIWQWRRQLKFGDQYKTAHRIVGLSLRFRREFGLTRLPFLGSSQPLKGVAKNEIGLYKQAFLDDFNERQLHLKKLFNIVQKLYEESLEVEGLIGEKDAGLTIPLETDYRRLNEAFEEYTQFIHSIQSGTLSDEDLALFRSNHDILFSTEDDYFTKRVDIEIENIKNRLKKYTK